VGSVGVRRALKLCRGPRFTKAEGKADKLWDMALDGAAENEF
jgi:hypothetical protein